MENENREKGMRHDSYRKPKEVVERVIYRYMQGESIEAIALSQKLSRQTVHKWLHQAKVPIRYKYHREKNSTPIKLCNAVAKVGYVAGLVDGEGCIWAQQTTTGRLHYAIRVYNTDRRCLDFAHEALGGWISSRSRGKFKTEYSWTVSNLIDVARLLEQITPFLIIKRQKAGEALEYARQMLGDYYEPLVLKPLEMLPISIQIDQQE